MRGWTAKEARRRQMWGSRHRKDRPIVEYGDGDLSAFSLYTITLHLVRPDRQMTVAVEKAGAKMCTSGAPLLLLRSLEAARRTKRECSGLLRHPLHNAARPLEGVLATY